MNRNFASLMLFCSLTLLALQSASAVSISWVPGNAGNANDTADGDAFTGGNPELRRGGL